MGNFEKLSVLVIVVIIVMILVVAIYTWQENPAGPETADTGSSSNTNANTSIANNAPKSPWANDVDPRPDKPELPPASDHVTPPAPVDIPVPQPEPRPGETLATTDPEVDNEPWIYEVQSGEVLSVIASRELKTVRRMPEIIALNPGMDPDHLTIGQKIKMPARGQVGPTPRRGGPNVGPAPVRGGEGSPVAGSTYTTRRGDRLDNIAKLAYGNVERWPEIFAINKEKVTNPFRLDAGVKLKLPR